MNRGNGLFRCIRLVVIQILITLALIEVGARIFDPTGISYFPETARYMDKLLLDDQVGYRNPPGLTGDYYGETVRINALGLRDAELSEKKAGEFRILAMGDSMPFGIGVSAEDSYPHQLESRLNKAGPGRSVRTLNMGVMSYNTEQELAQLKSLGLALKPDLVTLLFSKNDIETRMWMYNKRHKWYSRLTQRSYAGSLLYLLYKDIRVRMTCHKAGGAGSQYNEAPENRLNSRFEIEQYRPDSPRWLAIDRSLSEMNTLLRSQGIPFVLFTPDVPSYVFERLQAVAKREGFPLVSLSHKKDPRWAGMDECRFHNSVTDGHPSVLGHEVLATLMAESLESMGLLARSEDTAPAGI
jgi:lysophospholipase L1-like esterase